MNRSIIRYVSGRILMLTGALMLLPLAVAFIYREPQGQKLAYLAGALLTMALGLVFGLKKPRDTRFYAREGLVICSLVWVLMSWLGAVPLRLSGECASMFDAFFEISSGFTTTGASIMQGVEQLHHSTLFWRAFTHLIGGMGVLVFALALLPKADAGSVHMMKAEVPGPAFGKLVSSLRTTARILYAIYLAMTLALTAALLLAGMPLFDALCHAMATAGTGGFGIKNTSIAWYDSAAVDMILSVGMLMFGVNFNLYYLLLLRKARDVFRDEELKWYLGLVVGAVVLISLNVWPLYRNVPRMLRDVVFTVSSIITTTGFSTADFGAWPVFSQVVLVGLMFSGAMAGSTAGGLKVARLVLYSKMAQAEMRRQREPGRIVPIMFNRKAVSPAAEHSVAGYLIIYLAVFLILLLLVSTNAGDFTEAFSAVAATMNNIGPGLGRVGPTGNYAHFNAFTKLVMSLGMIAGRLEVWPIVVLFTRTTWRRA